MTRQFWHKIYEVPKGSKIIGIPIKTPEVIFVNAETEHEQIFYPSDHEVVSSRVNYIYVEITEEERNSLRTQEDINVFAIKIFEEVRDKLGIRHYKVNEN